MRNKNLLSRLRVALLGALGASLLAFAARADVSATGTYETQVAIQVPAFRGLEPEVRLVYDSAVGNGSLGVGWRLAVGSTITRVGERHGAPAFDTTDGFMLDGQDLLPCTSGSLSPSCQTGGTHTARMESFERIRYDGTADVWTITGKQGHTRTYTPQLRATPGGPTTYRWALSRVEDTYGHSVNYDYRCDGADDCVPLAIRYGSGRACAGDIRDVPPGTLLPAGEIVFNWRTRTDRQARGIGQRVLDSRLLLSSVDVKMATRRVRAYQLVYASSPTTGAALLTLVQPFGNDAQFDAVGNVVSGTRLPAHTFRTASMLAQSQSWSASTHVQPPQALADTLPPLPGNGYAWERSDSQWYTSGGMQIRWMAGDVNGDGRTDFVLISGIQLGVAIAQRDGTFKFEVDTFSNQGWSGTTATSPIANVHTYLADFDGDGRADVMQALDAFYCDAQCPCGALSSVCKHTAFRVAKYKGDGTWDYFQHTTSRPYVGNVTTGGVIGWNMSVTVPLGIAYASATLASGTIWQWSNTWLEDNWFVGDVDGDGKTDFIGISRWDHPRAGGGTYKAVRLRSVRSGGIDVESGEIVTDTDWPWDDNHVNKSRFFVADVDGDLHADVMAVSFQSASTSSPEHVAFAVGRSNGDGTFTPSLTQSTRMWNDEDLWIPGDVNGDGRADFFHLVKQSANAVFSGDHASIEAAVGDGEGSFRFTASLETGEIWHYPIPCIGGWRATSWIPADVDGDGRTDLIHPFVQHDYNCLTPDSHDMTTHVIYSRPGGSFTVDPTSIGGGLYLPECRMEFSMGAGDVNGDGRDDFIYGNAFPSNGGCLLQEWRLYVTPSPVTAADRFNWSPADFNGDGRIDLFFVLFENPGYQVTTLIAEAGGNYTKHVASIAPSVTVPGLGYPQAAAWRAMDVGGGAGGAPDGRADLVLVDDDHEAKKLRVYTLLSNGDGTWRTHAQEWDTNGNTDYAVARWRTGDVDGDGRADLLRVSFTGTGIRIDTLRSLGDGAWMWSQADQLAGSDWADASAWNVIDANGDGRSDLVKVDTQRGNPASAVVTLLGRGDATFREVVDLAPVTFLDTRLWRPAELNGDGRADLVYVEETNVSGLHGVRVHMLVGTGDGHYRYQTSGTFHPGVPYFHDRQSFRVMDANGDGKSDLVHVSTTTSSLGVVSTDVLALENWFPDFHYTFKGLLPPTFTDVHAWRAMDVDADGAPDLLYVDGGNIYTLHLDAPPDRLASEQNGMGAEISVRYGTSAGAHAYLPTGSLVPVVGGLELIDHIGARVVVSAHSYSYAGALWSDAERQFLGFGKITRSDGRALTATTYEQTDTCGIRPQRIEARDAGGQLFGFQDLHYVKPTVTGQTPFTCLPWTFDAYECERTPGCRHTRTVHTFDLYGNEVRTEELGDVSDKSDDRLIESPVYPNTSAYIVAKPTYSSVFGLDASGNWQLLESTLFIYDGASTYATPPASHGELTREDRWDDTTGGYVTSTHSYDKHGNLSRTSGPATKHAPVGGHDDFTYDCTFQLYPVSRCTGKLCELASWDLIAGLQTGQTDASGESTIIAYDAAGRTTSIKWTDGSWMTTTYPGASQWGTSAQHIVTEHSDESANGTFSRTTWLDGLGRIINVVTEDGTAVLTEYNGATEQPRRRSDPFAVGMPLPPTWTVTEYDELGRPTRLTHADGSVRRISYHVGSAWYTDELGHITGEYFDGFGRVHNVAEVVSSCPFGISECQGQTQWTTYDYDGLDRLSGVIDALGNRSSVAWDSLSRREKTCDPDSGCWSYSYNPDGTLDAQTDANGGRLEHDYDDLGRIREKRYMNAGGRIIRTIHFTWDFDPRTGTLSGASAGQITGLTDRSKNIDIDDRVVYDKMGRVHERQRCLDRHCASWRAEYDLGGRVKRLVYPDSNGLLSAHSESVKYAYGDNGRINRILGYVNRVKYDAAGRVRELRLANNVVTTNTFDSKRGWLNRTETKDRQGRTLYAADYTHDVAARVRSLDIVNARRVHLDFWYDSLDRLTQVHSPNPAYQQEFSYDPIGRMRHDSRQGVRYFDDPNHVHALTSTDAGHKLHYDPRGNLIESDRLRLTWDPGGMPASIEDVQTGAISRYAYDDEGERLVKRTPASTTYYFSPLIEMDGNGELITYVDAGGMRIARRMGQDVAFYHTDHLGSVRVMTDAAGRVLNRYDFGAYGEVVTRTQRVPSDYGFGGAIADDESALTYLGARYYDPELAQFISADTVVPELYGPQTLNRYAYAYNSPINYADPSGHAPESRVVSDIYGRPIGTMWLPECVGCTGEMAPPGHTRESARKAVRDTRVDNAAEWAQWQPPMTPPPLVEAIDFDQLLADGRRQAETVLVPMAVGTTAAFAALVAGPAIVGMALGEGEGALTIGQWGIRGAKWYFGLATSKSGLTAIAFSGGINVFDQGMNYLDNPDKWEFHGRSLGWDIATAPLWNKASLSILGKWPIFNRETPVTLLGRSVPRLQGWNLLKVEGVFTGMAIGGGALRSIAGKGPLDQNLTSAVSQVPAGAARAIGQEFLLSLFPNQFPGGRQGGTYTLFSRTVGLVIGLWLRPPSGEKQQKERH
ncbi:MAG: FG-GAP-like repeat-containing protein [Acidobacteriia bacterium]|nr:FG-GAP-like repeat-containing protein [Terriglobia bacterium]